jgi:hypothetical protein
MINLAIRNIFVQTAKGFLTCREILRHGVNGFTSVQRKECCVFLSLLKFHLPRPEFRQSMIASTCVL